jgi:hypothetical protein
MAKPLKQYRVMIPVANDKTGKRYQIGDTVTTKDFGYDQIKAWQMKTPPVLLDNDVYVATLPMESK